MRLSRFALVAVMLFAIPAMAHADQQKVVFSSYTCAAQQIPCPDAGGYVAASEWAAYGNACMKIGFGYSSPSGFMDNTLGLDTDYCLTTIPGSFPKGYGAQLNPKCCVIKLPTGVCSMLCNLDTD